MAFPVGFSAPSQVGRFAPANEATNQGSLIAEISNAGALYYGPYIDVKLGRYKVTYQVSANHHLAGAFRLDVATSPDQKILAEKNFDESVGEEILEFDLDELRTLEFRVWTLGNEKMVFKGVFLSELETRPSEMLEASFNQDGFYRAALTVFSFGKQRLLFSTHQTSALGRTLCATTRVRSETIDENNAGGAVLDGTQHALSSILKD